MTVYEFYGQPSVKYYSRGMSGEQLTTLMLEVFGADLMFELARQYGVVERQRCMNVLKLVLALVFTGGTDKCGR